MVREGARREQKERKGRAHRVRSAAVWPELRQDAGRPVAQGLSDRPAPGDGRERRLCPVGFLCVSLSVLKSSRGKRGGTLVQTEVFSYAQ